MYPESKKQYDRDFLLQFQANSVNKPIGLPNIPDIILDSVSIFMWSCSLVVQEMTWYIMKIVRCNVNKKKNLCKL